MHRPGPALHAFRNAEAGGGPPRKATCLIPVPVPHIENAIVECDRQLISVWRNCQNLLSMLPPEQFSPFLAVSHCGKLLLAFIRLSSQLNYRAFLDCEEASTIEYQIRCWANHAKVELPIASIAGCVDDKNCGSKGNYPGRTG